MSETGTTDAAPPGWYPDTRGDGSVWRYWDGTAWTNHTHSYGRTPTGSESPPPRATHVSTGPTTHSSDDRPRRRGRTIGWGALGAFVVGALVIAIALLNGQEVKQVDIRGGKIEFFSRGAQELTPDDVEAIEESQPEIDARVEDLTERAEEEGADVAPELVGDFEGTWDGTPGVQYVITQFGDAAVIEEQTAFGVTAYGEGTIFDDTATFFFTATDGSQGRADLVLVDDDRIEGTFTNFTWGVSPAAMTRR